MPKFHFVFLALVPVILISACHKTFITDDKNRPVVGPVESPKAPADSEASAKAKTDLNTLRVDCTFQTTSTLKMQLVLDTTAKSESAVGISMFSTAKGQTAASEYLKVIKQEKLKNEIVAEYKGENVRISLSLFKIGEKTDVLVNDEDVYNCN